MARGERRKTRLEFIRSIILEFGFKIAPTVFMGLIIQLTANHRKEYWDVPLTRVNVVNFYQGVANAFGLQLALRSAGALHPLFNQVNAFLKAVRERLLPMTRGAGDKLPVLWHIPICLLDKDDQFIRAFVYLHKTGRVSIVSELKLAQEKAEKGFVVCQVIRPREDRED